jgi:hypothetical protein
MTKALVPSKKSSSVQYVVANPRGIPEGRHILRIGDKRYFEGDLYDGPADERLIRDGFLVMDAPRLAVAKEPSEGVPA